MRLYRALILVGEPLIILWLYWRRWRGREDSERLRERFGQSAELRPSGQIIWFHAASVGEVNSIWDLVQKFHLQYPNWSVLLTTGTRTSSARVAQFQASGADWLIHQYAPVDHPRYIGRFLTHWQPCAAFFVESELWPNLITLTRKRVSFLGLINGRLSQTSFERWQKQRTNYQTIMRCFDLILAQDKITADRMRALGISGVKMLGNLKLDGPPPQLNETRLQAYRQAIGARPVWLYASSHDDEETLAMQAHHSLQSQFPDLLTIIVPRHPERADSVCKSSARKNAPFMRLSDKTPPKPETAFIIGDTIGDMGLVYSLACVCVIGGTLVPHGGQNPLEAARLNCAILHGPHVGNFSEIFKALNGLGGAHALTRESLAPNLAHFLTDKAAREDMVDNAQTYLSYHEGTCERILSQIVTCFERFGIGHA